MIKRTPRTIVVFVRYDSSYTFPLRFSTNTLRPNPLNIVINKYLNRGWTEKYGEQVIDMLENPKQSVMYLKSNGIITKVLAKFILIHIDEFDYKVIRWNKEIGYGNE